ncbi:MAG TPA: TRAP transporter small permease subunit, partial [Marinilabiliaceae bacterium]|nr:TRAP transporter small permease subunit [Marinilabiliaceae bacterium]
MNFRQRIDKILEFFLVVLMGTLVINVVWQVLSRFVFKNPSSFTDELATFLLIWVGLAGAAYV